MAYPRGHFNKGLDAIAQKWLKDVRAVDEIQLRVEVTHEQLNAAEALILAGVISFEDVLEPRSREETQEFRRWLWSQPDPGDAKQVAGAYPAATTGGAKAS